MSFKNLLAKATPFIIRNYGKILIVAFFITLFMGISAMNLHFQEDMRDGMPLEVDVFALQERITEEFRGTEGIIIAISLNDRFAAEDTLRDIRDPSVISSIVELHKRLEKEPLVYEVHSIAPIFENNIPIDVDGVKQVLNFVPQSNEFFNDDYSGVLVFVAIDSNLIDGGSDIIADSIYGHVNSISKPAGVDIRMTGSAPLMSEILEVMESDKIITTSAAMIIIFVLLIVLLRSLARGILVFLPLIFTVVWTYGSLTILGISITMTTVMTGAVLIGIGVEYGVFIVTRFYEEARAHTIEEALTIAVSDIGSSTLGSALTTTAAFFSLAISVIPMIRDTGITLGIGIIFCWIAATIITPCFIIFREKIRGNPDLLHENHKKKGLIGKILKLLEPFELVAEKHMNKLFKAYGNFLSKYTYGVVAVLLIFTVFMFQQSMLIELVASQTEDWLPAGTEVADTFKYVNDEFPGLLSGLTIVIDSNGDVRDPKVLELVDTIAQQVKTVDGVLGVESATDVIKGATNGRIPNSINSVKDIVNQNKAIESQLGRYISEDYSTSLIQISVMNDLDTNKLKKDLESVMTIDAPYGVVISVTGAAIEDARMSELSQETMGKTAMLSLVLIVIILLGIFASIKYGIIPLIVIIIGVIWAYGIFVLVGINLTTESSGVLSMILGIGIDFGIQITSRFRYELKKHEKALAMTSAITGVFYPMMITAIAASIGFLCLRFGNLPVMSDMGIMMATGVVSCMIASLTILPAILLVFTNSNKDLRKRNGVEL